MTGKRLVGPILVGATLLALYSPVFLWLITVWFNSPYYTHGFAVLPISAFIAWKKRGELVRKKPSWAGSVVFLAGLIVYGTSFILRVYWLSAFSFIITASGLAIYLYGVRAARTLMFPICFLIFMVPLPFLGQLGLFMQSISARGSASLVAAVGIPVTRTGAEVCLADSAFIIGMPCSGMNTLIALLALAAIFVYIVNGPYYKRGILLALAFPVAIGANIMRIALLLVIAHFWGTEAAMTFFHGFSSLGLFLIAFAILAFFSRLLGCRFKV
ncbi:exosortase/archaeosortase family protein [Chloroflexota bacterium]